MSARQNGLQRQLLERSNVGADCPGPAWGATCDSPFWCLRAQSAVTPTHAKGGIFSPFSVVHLMKSAKIFSKILLFCGGWGWDWSDTICIYTKGQARMYVCLPVCPRLVSAISRCWRALCARSSCWARSAWQTDRRTDRQTDKQTNKQTNRHTDRQTDRQTDRRTHAQRFTFFPPQQSGERISASVAIKKGPPAMQKLKCSGAPALVRSA